MNYLVELYDAKGKKVYNFRGETAMKALLNLAELAQSLETYPFTTASCYHNQIVVWEVELKGELLS